MNYCVYSLVFSGNIKAFSLHFSPSSLNWLKSVLIFKTSVFIILLGMKLFPETRAGGFGCLKPSSATKKPKRANIKTFLVVIKECLDSISYILTTVKINSYSFQHFAYIFVFSNNNKCSKYSNRFYLYATPNENLFNFFLD